MCRRALIFIIQKGENIKTVFPTMTSIFGESFFLFTPELDLTLRGLFYFYFHSQCFYFDGQTQMGDVLINLAFYKHYEFSQIARSILSKRSIVVFFQGPHSGLGISLGRIFTTLIWINDVLISFSPPFFFPLAPSTHLFFSVINTAVGRIGALWGSQGARPWSFFSPVQDGSALPASLRRRH